MRFNNENLIMKHTEKYLQAKWVTQNPEGYDERDVIDAKRYCNAYLEGYSQALSIANVVGQSEQLKAFREWTRENLDEKDIVTQQAVDRYLESL